MPRPLVQKKKKKDVYSAMFESEFENKSNIVDRSESDTYTSDSDVGDDLVKAQVPRWHRIIDMDTLNANISTKVVCAYCHSSMSLDK